MPHNCVRRAIANRKYTLWPGSSPNYLNASKRFLASQNRSFSFWATLTTTKQGVSCGFWMKDLSDGCPERLKYKFWIAYRYENSLPSSKIEMMSRLLEIFYF